MKLHPIKQCLLLLVLGPWTGLNFAAEPNLLRFSEDDILKTSLRWLDLQPRVIRPAAIAVAAVPQSTQNSPAAIDFTAAGIENYSELAVGKLLFVRPSGQAGSCTASFVGSNKVLLTAANCIYSADGVANEDFVFVSAYGSVVQQMYEISCIALPDGWMTGKGADQWRFNYAFLRTLRASASGGLGMTNALVPDRLSQIGYADNIGEGRKMQQQEGDAAMTNDGLVSTARTTLGAATSGNLWARNSIIFSLSSHYDPQHPDILLGPRFTAETMSMLSRLRKGC